MPLTNAQYDEIMRRYDAAKARHQRLLYDRRREIEGSLPEVIALENSIRDAGLKKTRERLLKLPSDWDLEETIRKLAEEKTRLLTANGYPGDYLESSYDCPVCKDTGFVNGRKCRCFQQAAIELLYAQSHLEDILALENFDAFDEQWYDASEMDPSTGKSALALARNARETALDYVRRFPEDKGNLLIFGGTGTGKTFLTHCIAREVIDRGFSLIYFPAYRLFEELADQTFRSDQSDLPDYVRECDLLIIDDLGTELTNQFVQARLFLLVNERLLLKKGTIISTNLEPVELMENYSERTSSRIFSNYRSIALYGADIRQKKRLRKG